MMMIVIKRDDDKLCVAVGSSRSEYGEKAQGKNH